MLHHKGELRAPCLDGLYLGMGAVPFLRDGGSPAFKIGIVIYAAFLQPGEGLCGQFQILYLRPMLEPSLFCLKIVQQTDTVVALFRLTGRTGGTGDPCGNGFLRVVDTQGLHSGKSLLIGGAAGDIFSSLYLIAFTLQAGK